MSGETGETGGVQNLARLDMIQYSKTIMSYMLYTKLSLGHWAGDDANPRQECSMKVRAIYE